MNDTLQIVSIALTASFIGVIIRMVRARRLRAKYSFLWIMVGTVILFFCAVPGLMVNTAQAVGIVYPPALLFLGAIMLLLFIAVHFSWELSRIEERSRTLTEELALALERISELERAKAPRAVRDPTVFPVDAEPHNEPRPIAR